VTLCPQDLTTTSMKKQCVWNQIGWQVKLREGQSLSFMITPPSLSKKLEV